MDHASDREIVGIVLAAGAGTRLVPLSSVLPKPLCPVGNVPLLDLAIERVLRCAGMVAVNLHHDADAILHHLGRRGTGLGSTVHVCIEQPEPLGTAGAIGNLVDWIDGRDVLVVNADAWSLDPLTGFLADRDPDRITLLAHRTDEFGPRIGVIATAIPWKFVKDLEPVPSGLYEVLWRDAHDRGELDVVRSDQLFVDCGTPADYLRANMQAVDIVGHSIIDPTATVADDSRVVGSVIGARAIVRGTVIDSVVWPDQIVEVDDVLDGAIRASAELTLRPEQTGGSPRA